MTGTEKQVKWAMEIKENYITEIKELVVALETRKNNEQGKSFIAFLTNFSDKETIKANASRMLELVKTVQTELENEESAEFFIDNKKDEIMNITKMIIRHF